MAKKKNMTQDQVLKIKGINRGLEKAIGRHLNSTGVNYVYEEKRYPFVQPAKDRHYTPDFFLYDKEGNLKILIEAKGRLSKADRDKMLWFKKAYPEKDIRMVFSNSRQKCEGRKITCGQWCDKEGILYADELIPQEWIDEVKNGS